MMMELNINVIKIKKAVCILWLYTHSGGLNLQIIKYPLKNKINKASHPIQYRSMIVALCLLMAIENNTKTIITVGILNKFTVVINDFFAPQRCHIAKQAYRLVNINNRKFFIPVPVLVYLFRDVPDLQSEVAGLVICCNFSYI
jgi:hypothetical protein